MDKLYSIYIPKYKGERAEFLITKVINKFMLHNKNVTGIICAPGYLSVNEKTIESHIKKLETTMCNKLRKLDIILAPGYNSENKAKSSNKKIITKYNEEIDNSLNFNRIDLNFKETKDHKKMIFFYEDDCKSNNSYVEHNFKFENINVSAILIGSTNQNLTSYYGGKGRIADKGEADLFMFIADENIVNRFMYEMSEDEKMYEIIIFEQKWINTAPQDYLNKILHNFLDNSIEK